MDCPIQALYLAVQCNFWCLWFGGSQSVDLDVWKAYGLQVLSIPVTEIDNIEKANLNFIWLYSIAY